MTSRTFLICAPYTDVGIMSKAALDGDVHVDDWQRTLNKMFPGWAVSIETAGHDLGRVKTCNNTLLMAGIGRRKGAPPNVEWFVQIFAAGAAVGAAWDARTVKSAEWERNSG